MTTKIFTGKIEKIFSDPITNPTKYDTEYGYKFRLALIVSSGDTKETIRFWGSKSEQFTVKSGEEWIALCEGDEISFPYESKPYGDKITHSAKRSNVTLLNKGDGVPAKVAPELSTAITVHKQQPQNVGIAVGHALNCASVLHAGTTVDIKKVEHTAKNILRLAESLRNDYDNIMKPKKDVDNEGVPVEPISEDKIPF